jgi:uncharacterized Rossmann fold enzyme
MDRAIALASYLGAQSVTRAGFASAPTAEEIAEAWRRAGVPLVEPVED